MVELFDSGAKGAFSSEGADMDFVQNDVVPVPAAQSQSVVAHRIDDLARTVNVVRLKARGRIGNHHPVRSTYW